MLIAWHNQCTKITKVYNNYLISTEIKENAKNNNKNIKGSYISIYHYAYILYNDGSKEKIIN